MRNVLCGLTLGLILCFVVGSVRAELVDATADLSNPSFESPSLDLIEGSTLDGCNYQQNLPTDWSGGFSDTSTDQNQNSLRHYRPHTSGLKSNGGYFWDPTDGFNGAAIILRTSTVPLGWMYQSLGTVTEDDIGKTLRATVDSSIRAHMAQSAGERRISFRTGVTAGRNGSCGELVSMSVPTATRTAGEDDPWATLVEYFQPAEEHLGQEVFLVFSVEDVGAAYDGQYQFDNVQLSAVPEPGTMCLLIVGLFGLMGWGCWQCR